jgi:hypothetical protein
MEGALNGLLLNSRNRCDIGDYGAAVAQMAVAMTVVGALLTWKKTDH